MSETHPKIAAAMRRDRKRAALRGIVTRSADAPLDMPAQRVFARTRALIPARFRR